MCADSMAKSARAAFRFRFRIEPALARPDPAGRRRTSSPSSLLPLASRRRGHECGREGDAAPGGLGSLDPSRSPPALQAEATGPPPRLSSRPPSPNPHPSDRLQDRPSPRPPRPGRPLAHRACETAAARTHPRHTFRSALAPTRPERPHWARVTRPTRSEPQTRTCKADSDTNPPPPRGARLVH